MAKIRIYCSFCRNFLPFKKDKFAKNALEALINSNYTPIPAVFPAPTEALVLAQIFILNIPGMYTDVDLQKTTKLAIKLFVKGLKHS